MKKTLIALAVLAASGASFAQATISGAISAGYIAKSSPVSGDTGGLGFDDTAVKFSVSEDLGGGNKVTGELNMNGLNRTASALGGRNAILAVSTGAGTFELASKAYDNYIVTAGAGIGKLVDDIRDPGADAFTYSNTFGPVSVSLIHREPNTGLGVGAAGVNTQRDNAAMASIAMGNLSANLTYRSFDGKGTSAATPDNFDNQTAVGLGYDFGVAKVSAAFGQTKYMLGNSNDTGLNVSVPLGALTLGAAFENRTTSDLGAASTLGANGTRTGAQLTAGYTLSKRTSLNLRYRKWDESVGPKTATNETFAYIAHSF